MNILKPLFYIVYDPALREWVLQSHPDLQHAPIRFPEMARGPGAIGLFGALSFCCYRRRDRGGRIRIRFHDEVLEVSFDAQPNAELASMNPTPSPEPEDGSP